MGRWKDGKMVLRWTPSGFLDVEKRYRRIMGHEDLWTLKSILGQKKVDEKEKAAYAYEPEAPPSGTFNWIRDSIMETK